jgi:hypothetical protein
VGGCHDDPEDQRHLQGAEEVEEEVEAVTVAARRGAAICLALVFAGAAAPAEAAKPFAKGFWGPTRIDGVSQFPIYRELGVNLFQTVLNWGSAAPVRPAKPTDPADPAYLWPPEIDDALEQARGHGMRVLLLLIGAPGWANGGKPWQHAPERARDFADFARAAARRYPAVRHWQIWGEPSKPSNFQPLVAQEIGEPLTPVQARAPKRYSRLLDAAYAQLKAVDRANLVIGGNTYTTGAIRPGNWVRNMKLPDGRPPRMDLFGHNPFSFRRPDLRNEPLLDGSVDFSDVRRFGRQVNRHLRRRGGKRIKLFLSEWTVPTGPDREFNFHVRPATQATWITSGFRIARSLTGIYGLGWVHLRDEAPSADGDPVIRGGLMDHLGAKKPGYEAFRRG